jgi:Cu2+-exporting ATPase
VIDTVIFDKTGTLTLGEFGVVGIATVDGWSSAQAFGLAAAIEGDSEHTIASSIHRSPEVRGLDLPKISHFEAIEGRGVRASSNGNSVYIGGPRMLEMLALSLSEPVQTLTDQAIKRGQSVVYLIDDDQVVAAFALADVIRPENKEAISKLHDMGVEVAMLTGDSQAVARAVAEELGINQVFAEILPEHKDRKVTELQAQGKKVAMVGDGVNDAPALTRADVGIAIGGGTDVAIKSAGIILVKSNPLDVVKIFALTRPAIARCCRTCGGQPATT